jgi:hypothetical protein
MGKLEYSEAATEVLNILAYTNKEDVEKIPKKFIKFLTDISNKNYDVKFDYEQPLKGLNLRKETRELLGFIYITWWCNEEERNEYKKIIRSNNMLNQDLEYKYGIEDIFKEEPEKLKASKTQNVAENGIVSSEDGNFFKKFLNKILCFLGIKKERGF